MQQVIEKIALANIRIEGDTQPRASLDLMYVADLAQAIQNGANIPPILTYYDGSDYWLADGFHRYHASKQIDQTTINAEIRQGTRRDAQLFSFGANDDHGLRRTQDDKRRSIAAMLKDPEWCLWSDSEIARQCKVDHKTVASYRLRYLGNSQDISERLVQRNGTTYTMNAANIGHSTTPELSNEETFTLTLPDEKTIENPDSWKLTAFVAEVPKYDPALAVPKGYEPWKAETITEEDHYFNAVDNGTLDYYHDDLRREAILRDREQREAPTKSATLTALQSSESVEWYTPQDYVDAARELMGAIDIDPASCDLANQTVKAIQFYTKAENGLIQSWAGRVWLNPPYGVDSGVSNQEVWSHQLIERYEAGLVSEAVLLVNANTEAKWFQPLYNYLICFTNHRIRFYNADGASSQPTQGNALVYFGNQKSRFIELFSQFGVIVRSTDKNDY